MKLLACILLLLSATVTLANWQLRTDGFYHFGDVYGPHTRTFVTGCYSGGCYNAGYYQYTPVAVSAKAKSLEELLIDLAAAKQTDKARLDLIDRLGLKAEPSQPSAYYNPYGAIGGTGSTFAGTTQQIIITDPFAALDLNAANQAFALSVQEMNRSLDRAVGAQGASYDKAVAAHYEALRLKLTHEAIIKAAAKPTVIQTTANVTQTLPGFPTARGSVFRDVMQAGCRRCHSGSGKAVSKFNLDAYDALTPDQQRRVHDVVKSGAMPPAGEPVLPVWMKGVWEQNRP